jgi:hypothetical protein
MLIRVKTTLIAANNKISSKSAVTFDNKNNHLVRWKRRLSPRPPPPCEAIKQHKSLIIR